MDRPPGPGEGPTRQARRRPPRPAESPGSRPWSGARPGWDSGSIRQRGPKAEHRHRSGRATPRARGGASRRTATGPRQPTSRGYPAGSRGRPSAPRGADDRRSQDAIAPGSHGEHAWALRHRHVDVGVETGEAVAGVDDVGASTGDAGTRRKPRRSSSAAPPPGGGAAARDRNGPLSSDPFVNPVLPSPSVDGAGFLVQVVHQHELAQRVGRREVGLAAADLA